MPTKLVLFDIDGTILLTSGAGRRAMFAAISEEVDLDGPSSRIRFDGKTDPQIVAELLAAAGNRAAPSPQRISAICRRYVELLSEELARPTTRTTVMPGVPALLDRLEAQGGIVLGLLTGNVAGGASLKLQSAGIDPARFRVGAFGSDSPHRPELPPIAVERATRYFGRGLSGNEVVIIGDTPADIACGECISARAVAVATGGYTVSDLQACRPYAVFEDLSDTDGVMSSIID
ncbi:MAG TPA: HAD family hydrolase [Gemmatimonadales bacterium]|nr:HAD family hydrolase [Gemmatimonadales bacterium]